METPETAFSAQMPLKSKRKTRSINLINTETGSFSFSSQSSFSGNVDCKTTTGPSVAINLEHTPEFHGDVISCIIEGNGTNLVGKCSGEAEQKALSCSSISVDSSFPVVIGKSIDIQSANTLSATGQCTVKGGKMFSSIPGKYSTEALQWSEDLPGRSDPSENSSHGIKRPGSILTKCEHVHCFLEEEDASLAGAANYVTDGLRCDSHQSTDSVKTPTEQNDGNQFSAEAANSSDCCEHSKFTEPVDVTGKQDLSLLSRAVDDGDSSGELVDVRVCDICGHVGREALLAVCSRCGDGAEHIYCMRIKLDNPPGGNWMCEECASFERQIESQVVTGTSSGLARQSSFNEYQQCSGEIYLGIKESGNIKQPPVEKPDHKLLATAPKRKSLHRSLPSTMMNRVLQKSASLKDMNRSECPVFSSESEVPIKERRFLAHSMNKSLTDGRQATGRPFLKRSFSVISNSDVPTSPRCPFNSTYEERKKIAVARHTKFRLDLVPKVTDLEKASHGTRNVEKAVGCIDGKASNSGRMPAGATTQLMPYPDERNKACFSVGTETSSNRLKAKQSLVGAIFEPVSRVDGCHVKTTDKVQLETSPSVKRVPPGVIHSSAVPEPDRIWKGVLKFGKRGNLPSYCDGIQAHLSATASPRVSEVVLKFPQEVHLRAIPRSDAWPIQFRKDGASEDHIALYFFAEDHHSYHRTYRRLLECLIANDLSLVADHNSIELLIFPSNVLPQRSQRWNSLSYLWGVFREVKTRSPHYFPVSSYVEKGYIPNLNVEAEMQHLSASPIKEAFRATFSGNASPGNALHHPIQIGELQAASLITCKITSHEPHVSQVPKHLFSKNIDGSIAYGTEISLAGHPIKQLQLLGDMEVIEDLQKEDKCGPGCLEAKHEGDIGLLLQPDIHASSRSGNLSIENYGSHRFINDLNGTAYMIDPSFSASPDGVLRYIHPHSEVWFNSAGERMDRMDVDPNLDLCLGSMTKSPKQDYPAPFIDPSNRDYFPLQRRNVDVNLSLGLSTYSHKVGIPYARLM